MRESLVVTGIGVVAPTGTTADEHWAATLEGRSGLGPITRFDPAAYPVRIAGEVKGFAATEHLSSRLTTQTDHWTHMGLVAAESALADAGTVPAELPEYEMAVVTASSSGGTEFGQREMTGLWSLGPEHVGAYQSIAWFYAATTGQISIRHGMRGPCAALATEQAGGLDAVGQARRTLRAGARLALVGGTDASLCPYGLVAQLSSRALSTVSDPARAYIPFDVSACGYVPGEGGAMFVMEHGKDGARTADRYGEVLGYAATFDPAPGRGRPPGLRRAIELALADAGLRPGEIDVVFADAMGVPAADRMEAEALCAVFGPRAVPVTAPKTLTGRLYAGGAALDLVTALLALRDGVIPPTAGVVELDRTLGLDLVGDEPRELRLRTALVVARGHGGFNSALVLGR
ncbi:ketosynthase chain-length factor [Microbispora hainanensis]|uniref:Ketosynthase chain-length factor n=1 Tax=Microbispora hainanensis TaxID=568844 RepID=A0A544Z2P7_9ACTN|nr:ketosynthase chain-length factor [Microbispora hainanensis]TQS23329.1 ketosynthase chain-length factor [Microbispora hainanensis]